MMAQQAAAPGVNLAWLVYAYPALLAVVAGYCSDRVLGHRGFGLTGNVLFLSLGIVVGIFAMRGIQGVL